MSAVKKDPPLTPQSYKEVKGLSYNNLLYLCKDACIKTFRVGRDALEILLCESLNLSTTGTHRDGQQKPRLDDHCLDEKELKEFTSLTPAFVQALDGWTKNIKDVPDVDIGAVKNYLLASNDPDFTKASLKKYKLTRAYEHLKANHINSLMFHPLPDSETFCIVKAQCLPSQSTESRRVKWLHVILDKRLGEPYGAFCICTVG